MPTPSELAADAEPITPGASVPGLADLVTQMAASKARLDELDEQRKALQAHYDELHKRALPDALRAAGLERASFRVGTLSLRHKTYPRIAKGREMEARTWLIMRDLGDVLTIAPAALKELVTDLIEAGRTVPDFIQTYTEEVATLTAPRGAKSEWQRARR